MQQQATSQLETDVACLKQYEIACQNGSVTTEQFNNIMGKASSTAVEYTANIKAGTGSAQSYAQAQKANNAALQSVSTGASIASKAVKVLSAAMNTIAITAIFSLVSKGISWITEQIDNYIHRNEIAIKKAEELLETFKSEIDSITSNQDKISHYSDEFKELSKGVDDLGRNVSLTANEYSRYQSIVKEIVGINPSLISGYDEENNVLTDKNGLIETSIQLLKDEYKQKLKNLSLPDNVDTAIEGAIGRYNEAKDALIKATEVPRILQADTFDYIMEDGSTESGRLSYDLSDIISDVIGVDRNRWNESVSEYVYNNLDSILQNMDKIKERASQTKDGIMGLNDNQLIALIDYFENLNILYNDLNNASISANSTLQYVAMSEEAYSNLSDVQKKFVSDYINSIKITSDMTEREKNNIRNSIILLTQKVSEISDSSVKKAFTDFYTPSLDDESVSEYVDRVEATFQTIQKYCEENGITLPISLESKISDVNTQIDNVKNKLQDEFDDKVGELSLPDLQIASEKITVSDGDLLSWDELKSKIEEAKITSDIAEDSFDNISEKITQIQENASDAVANIKIFNDAIDKVNNGENLSYDEVSELLKLDPSLASNFTKTVDGYSIAIDELIAANDRIKGVSSSNIEQNITDTTQKIADSEARIKKLNEERQKLYAEINANKGNEHYNGNETYERLLDIDEEIENLTNSIKNGQDLLSALQITFGEISETASTIQQISLSDLSSSYDLLNSVTEEFNKNGNITVSTLESIKNTYPRMKSVVDQYLQGLIDENELIEQLSNAYKTDEDNYYKYLLLKLGYEEDYINEAFEGNDSIVDYFAENYKTDLTNFKDYIRQKQAIQESFDKLVGEGVSEFWTEEGGYTDAFLDLKGDSKVIIDGIIHEYQEAMDNLDLDFQTKGEKFEKDLEGIKSRTSSALNAESDSKSSSSSDKFSKTFDWIETAIEKVSKAASKLGNIVSNTFKSWTDRNSALKKQIKEVNKEIELQQQAYDVYTQKANSVGLSDYWTNKIRNGSIDISVITDEDLADKIDEFKEWYDKAQDCKDAIDELNDSLSDLYMTSFDNVVAKYDDILSEIDFNKSMLDEKISQSAQSSYSSYDKNQAALSKNIGYYEQLIAQEKKNIVQLEKEKAELIAILQLGIQNGTIVEGTEDWAKMRDQIDSITLAIAKANTSILDYGESINKVYEDLFNNISNKFEHQLNEIQHLSNSYDIGIRSLEAKGYLGSVNFYTALQDSQRESISLLKQELSSLEQAFAESGVEEYSDEWFEMREKILDVNKAIREGELSLLEYAKALREVEWEHFDYLQERISDITTEADFLIDLLDSSTLFDDKGNFTDKGLATLGLHAQNYNVYMAQADKYYQELLSIEKELASDPYNTDLVKRREELLELQQKSILAAEDEKQAMIDLAKSGIEAELTALKELIEAYTDALDSAKSLHDYQRKIADQTSEIASLEKQLLAYENDNSEEARATKQKIKTNLEKAKDDLKETEYEKYISDQKELLDDLYAEYEEYMNKRLDNVDALLEDMIKTVNENAGEISDTLSSTAREVGYELSDSMQVIWSNAAGSITDVVSLYGGEFSDKLTTVNQALNMIESNTAKFVQAANEFASQSINDIKSELNELSNAISGSQSGSGDNGSGSSNDSDKPSNPVPEPKPNPTTPTPTPSNPSPNPGKTIEVGGKINAGNAPIYDYAGAPPSAGEKQVFANDPIYTVLNELDGFLKVRWHKLSSGVTGWFKKSDVKAYKTGGLVDFTGLAQLDGTPSKPEYVLSPEETKNFLALNETLKNVDVKKLLGINNTPNLDDFVNTRSMMSDIRAIQNSNLSTNTNFGDVNISIEHVEDYNDFVNQLKSDRQFEKMVQAMTIDRAAGRSSLAKNKFRW